MKKTFKIIVSAVLCVCFILGVAPLTFAEEGTSAVLDNLYGDGMLFQQKKNAVITGKGKGGAEVSCELKDDGGKTVAKAKTVENKKGGFNLSFTAPAGGYKSYTIDFYEDGVLFRTLNDVVFGELWLASGQSNMQYSFVMSDTYAQNSERSPWLRFLHVETFATYNGNPDEFPIEAQQDFEKGSCRWLKGTDNINNISAVSVYFAQKLEKELQMPVGVIASNLGGSLLISWLSRETVESDPAFADYSKNFESLYLSTEEWNSSKVDWYRTMTANYNKKIAPLHNLKIAGMLWYQGESEILMDWEIGYYTRGLELLQSSYSELFGFEGEKMPFIATQVAPYAYGDSRLSLHNDEFISFQNADPSSRAVTTIYDVDLGYLKEMGGIHPAAKQPVGERMAACAEGLVYGKSDCYTAATVESTRIDGSDFYVTFKNTGDGLKIEGSRAVGFALCDDSGVYVQADAEIVNSNTVRIFSDEVENPVGAAYAFSENNHEANLYSTLNGGNFLPAAPFATEKDGGELYWEDPAWARCDSSDGFLLAGDSFSGIRNLWNAENAQITADEDNAYKGGCLNIVSDSAKKKFSVSPLYSYKDGSDTEYYEIGLRDWSKYKTVTVMVRNNGENDVQLDKMKIYTNSVTWFSSDVNESRGDSVLIPADGQWHKLTFDLERLYLFGNECGAVYSRRKLDNINGFELCFKDGKNHSSDISIDEFRFSADGSEGARGKFEKCVSLADDPWEFFCSLFSTLFSLIAGIFTK